MILVTSDTIPGMRIVKTIGLVRGNTVRARHIGRDFMAVLRNLIGGEVVDYTKLLAESREQAVDRMMAEAQKLGANAVVTIRFVNAEIMKNTAELLAYGTAVVTEPDKP